jgi:uncharacterized protein YlaN (UPF0358 family)
MADENEKVEETALVLTKEEAESIVALALQKNNIKRALLPQPFYEQMLDGVHQMVAGLQAMGWKIQRPPVESGEA